MDFLDPKKKRAHKIRLFVGYGLMSVLIGIATTILVFEAYGYDVDRKTGSVIQNGLLFVDAHPEGARIFLNGEDKGLTSARLVIPDGRYTVELKRDGYRTWKRAFRLEGSVIERMVYPFMFPEKLDSEDVQLYASQPAFSAQSPDRRWVLVQQAGSLNGFDLFDLSKDPVNAAPLVLAETTFTNFGVGSHSLELAEWSNDNRHVMVKHVFDGGFEYIMINREDSAGVININKHFGADPHSITLRDKKFDQLYFHNINGGVLSTADVNTRTVSQVLDKVLAYKTYGTEDILYAATSDDLSKVVVRLKTSDAIYDVKELPTADSKYLLDISKFDGAWFILVGASAEKKVYVYKNPVDALNSPQSNGVLVPETVLRTTTPAQFVAFSANTRFMSLQSGSEFSVYDAEMERLYRYDTKLPIAAGDKATWMDGHRFVVNSQGRLKIFEFDGNNLQDIIALNNKVPYFDRDYTRLFTLSPSTGVPNKSALVLSYMRTANDR